MAIESPIIVVVSANAIPSTNAPGSGIPVSAEDGRTARAAIEGEKPPVPIADLTREELFANPDEIDVHGGDGHL